MEMYRPVFTVVRPGARRADGDDNRDNDFPVPASEIGHCEASEAVFADEAVEVCSVDAGGLSGGGDVAVVALEQAVDVLALALVDPALTKFLERLCEIDGGGRPRFG